MTITFLGGVGLFLLGMKLMTDGLKVAAGNALRGILARGTATTGRGILSGIVITAIVQSSTAVTIATIGFVNAGMMTLLQSVGVIIGSNVGTTGTSWLVALIGFNVNIQALAMPAIAIGMALRVTGGRSRRGALGEALTGFGVFFLGIDVLRDAFGDIGDRFDFARFAGDEIGSLLIFLSIGIVMTVLMNSSSAALAVILTATGAGVIPLNAAAAMVIGANIGTTSTALFSVIGATPNAKRAAMAMMFFALVAGVIAFVALPLLLAVSKGSAGLLGLDPQPAIVLAIFHTMTKLTGMAIVWPLTPWLVGSLERIFVTAEEDKGRPQHLDRNVAGTPALALAALALELERMGDIARSAASAVVSASSSLGASLEQDKAAIERLTYAVGEFTSEASRPADLPEAIGRALANGIRITQYYDDMVERALLIDRGGREEIRDSELATAVNDYRRRAIELIDSADARVRDFDPKRLREAQDDCEKSYQEAKQRLVHAGATGRIPVHHMVSRLDELSNIRRILDQAVKAALYSGGLHQVLGHSPGMDLVK